MASPPLSENLGGRVASDRTAVETKVQEERHRLAQRRTAELEGHQGLARRVRAAGKAPGILTADETLAKRYLELGALFVAVGIDVNLLTKNARALAQRFKAA